MTETSFDPFGLPPTFDPLGASSPPPPTAEQRLQALEDEVVVILKARLDGMEKAIEARLDDQMGRLVVRVAEMLEAERLALVGAVLPGRRGAADTLGECAE